MLCTLANVKAFLPIGTTDTEYDAVIEAILTAVSSRLAVEAGRILQGLASLEYDSSVETISVPGRQTQWLWLSRWPVVEVTEIVEALYGGFAAATALTANEGYQLDRWRGGIARIGWWLSGTLTVRATYTGGYTAAEEWVSKETYVVDDAVTYLGIVYRAKTGHTGVATLPSADETNWDPTDEVALPADLRQAAVMQTAFQFNRRRSLGLTAESVQGGSISSYASDELLPEVRQVMRQYRRLIG